AAQRGARSDGQGHPGVAERPAAQVGPRAGAPAVLVDPVGLPRREGRLVRGHGRVAARPGAPAAAGGHAPRPVRPVQRLPRASQQGLILFPIGTLSLVYPAGPGDLDALAYFFTTEPNSGPLRIIQTLSEAVTANPGIRAVTRAVRDWAAAHRSGELPVLTMEDRAGVLEITDTRACARTSRQLLTGLSRAVLLACDSAPRPARLAEIVGRDGGITASQDEIDAVVRKLRDDRLVLSMDDRLVGLVLHGPVPEHIPDYSEFPGGGLVAGPRPDAEPR